MPVIQPYEHDCDRCIWVGWFPGSDGRWGNMYFCPPRTEDERDRGSVVIRYSDRPDDYWSSPVGACVKGGLSMSEETFAEHIEAQALAEGETV